MTFAYRTLWKNLTSLLCSSTHISPKWAKIVSFGFPVWLFFNKFSIELAKSSPSCQSDDAIKGIARLGIIPELKNLWVLCGSNPIDGGAMIYPYQVCANTMTFM